MYVVEGRVPRSAAMAHEQGRVPYPHVQPPAAECVEALSTDALLAASHAAAASPGAVCADGAWQEVRHLLEAYRHRRKLGFVGDCGAPAAAADERPAPREGGADSAETEVQWLRRLWRPLQLVPAEATHGGFVHNTASVDSCGSRGGQTLAELSARLGELQTRVGESYGELNAARRRQAADAAGLRRQGESASAIACECDALRQQLSAVQAEVAQQTTQAGELGRWISAERQKRAEASTQAALLASAVAHMARGISDDRLHSRCEDELTTCRLQIQAAAAENAALTECLPARQTAAL